MCRCADAEVKGKHICQGHRACPWVALSRNGEDNIELLQDFLCYSLTKQQKFPLNKIKIIKKPSEPKKHKHSPKLFTYIVRKITYIAMNVLWGFSFISISSCQFAYKLYSVLGFLGNSQMSYSLSRCWTEIPALGWLGWQMPRTHSISPVLPPQKRLNSGAHSVIHSSHHHLAHSPCMAHTSLCRTGRWRNWWIPPLSKGNTDYCCFYISIMKKKEKK